MGYTIANTAKRAGVSADTVRRYERLGLLPAARRRASGYSEYDHDVALRVRFIVTALGLGFSLADIAELLALGADADAGSESVRRLANSKLSAVDRKLEQLQRLREVLVDLVDANPGRVGRDVCPVLNAIVSDVIV